MELYVHFPFCAKKCRYCDFTSYAGQASQMEKYTEALLGEAQLRTAEITEPIRTVYFGGGTPSLLPAGLMGQFIQSLKKILPLSEVREWTVEANPGTLTSPWLDQMLSLGVNRLSLGAQAFQPRLLSLLGRIHDAEAIGDAVRLARTAGFQNLSLDLIFGLPTQTLEDWRQTLEMAFALRPEHLSAYGLIPEEGTPIKKDLDEGRLTLPEPEEEREMYSLLRAMARQHSFSQYEISNFSLPGFECRHNLGYWFQEQYLGLGVSAASMTRLSRDASGRLRSYHRCTNTDSLARYLSGISSGCQDRREETEILPREAQFETLMLSLRTSAGLSDRFFQQFHGLSISDVPGLTERLATWRERGLLRAEKEVWTLTERGMDLQNTVLSDLLELFE